MSFVSGIQTTAEHDTAQFAVGTRGVDYDGKEYVYVQADSGGVTGAGYVVLIDPATYTADMIDTTNSGSGFGELVGVAPLAVTASYYFWAQVWGAASIRVAASCAANTAINTTATAGQLDDDQGVGSEDIAGIALTTANGGSAANAAGFLNYPTVGVTN